MSFMNMLTNHQSDLVLDHYSFYYFAKIDGPCRPWAWKSPLILLRFWDRGPHVFHEQGLVPSVSMDVAINFIVLLR